MNCVDLFHQQVRQKPNSLALAIPGKEAVTFAELLKLGVKAQSVYRSSKLGGLGGLEAGSSVLLFDHLSVRLYANVLALLAMGVNVVFVEPWMPIHEINKIIITTRPKVFASNFLGFLWGSRVKSIRQIPRWIRTSAIDSGSSRGDLTVESVDPTAPGILTFTSGTTGTPKGVVRSHGYLVRQHQVVSRRLETEKHQGTDLCIFANFALSNLASGRGSLLIPPSWSPKILKGLDDLPDKLRPVSLAAGPAFLLQLMKYSQLPSLKAIHIGGALTDCWIFEDGMEKWPTAHWTHVYGGSEVEPVALSDVRNAVAESRRAGYFQTLFLGGNVPEIRPKVEPNGLWVSGPHVCEEYIGNQQENDLLKKRDPDGTLWHFMGDRVIENSSGWWYQGRSGVPLAEFQLEQKLYTELQTSRCFIHSKSADSNPEKYLIGENLSPRRMQILKAFPEIRDVLDAKLFRDRRHRARIDRKKTLQKGAPWLVG